MGDLEDDEDTDEMRRKKQKVEGNENVRTDEPSSPIEEFYVNLTEDPMFIEKTGKIELRISDSKMKQDQTKFKESFDDNHPLAFQSRRSRTTGEIIREMAKFTPEALKSETRRYFKEVTDSLHIPKGLKLTWSSVVKYKSLVSGIQMHRDPNVYDGGMVVVIVERGNKPFCYRHNNSKCKLAIYSDVIITDFEGNENGKHAVGWTYWNSAVGTEDEERVSMVLSFQPCSEDSE